ncbi:MAG: AMP-binding protein [Bacteroidales bacterium]|nr:AMP-binding protein [Bacteroidales bacterium]
MKENLVSYFETSIKENWDLPALSDYKGASYTYGEVGSQIKKLHLLFKLAGIKKGDKISLVGKNSANWCMAFLSTVTYGAVIVPILPDFKPEDIMNIVNHSDSVFLFTSDTINQTLDKKEMPAVKASVSLENFGIIQTSVSSLPSSTEEIEKLCQKEYPEGINKQQYAFDPFPNENLAVINYTSGTTGFSKGVVLNLNSLSANIRYARENMPLKSGDSIVSFLPLAHTYGCAFEFMFPFSLGCHITFLTKTPSPQVIIEAFGVVKPHLVLAVPLIIEKIYKKQILPAISKGAAKTLIKLPLLNKLVYNKIKGSLTKAFGGRFHEVVIGGAALNAEVEALLARIKFPFSMGYGMTECGPLISYAGWQFRKKHSAGKVVDTLEITIDSDDPYNTVGEILVRGENVMLGYYKNEQATAEALDKDGWLHTGDLGIIDKENYVFIKGRSKSMILGPSGQNIYPEEIEEKINNLIYVQEGIVVERSGKIVALVYPDFAALEADGVPKEEVGEKMEEYRRELNAILPGYMGISKIETVDTEFEKTPKKSIKKFLYH